MTGRAAERFDKATPEIRERTLSAIPLRRMGRAEDVGNVVVFLASMESAFMTGAILDVNGGRSMA
jgi:3-oxoacyl-[acyl-carrier protein] reductase